MPIRLRVLLCCCLIVFSISFTLSARAQQDTTSNSTDNGDQVVEGTVVSSSRDTLVVRTDDGQYRLFTYARGATHPKLAAQGARVRITAGEAEAAATKAAKQLPSPQKFVRLKATSAVRLADGGLEFGRAQPSILSSSCLACTHKSGPFSTRGYSSGPMPNSISGKLLTS